MHITEKEYRVLRSLRTNWYGDAGESETWDFAVNDSDEPSGIKGKELSGVLSSLSKKGLIVCSEYSRTEGTICLTDDGRMIADRKQEELT